ncbi:hypothetical protein PEC301879_13020, partial [Pectobacterium carotovorum subsp. carotovorum]
GDDSGERQCPESRGKR